MPRGGGLGGAELGVGPTQCEAGAAPGGRGARQVANWCGAQPPHGRAALGTCGLGHSVKAEPCRPGHMRAETWHGSRRRRESPKLPKAQSSLACISQYCPGSPPTRRGMGWHAWWARGGGSGEETKRRGHWRERTHSQNKGFKIEFCKLVGSVISHR